MNSHSKTNQQIVQFFWLTFLFSWILWLPGVLITYQLITPNATINAANQVLKWIAGMGPSLAALYLIARSEGASGLKALFKRVLDFKLGIWYVPVFLLLPVILVLAHLLNMLLFHASFPQAGILEEPWWIPILLIIFYVMQFSEELGWRGFALDRLQRKWNALVSSIVLGSVWAIWHLPMFLTKGFGQHDYHLPFGQFMITLILVSILITWIQNNTKGSLLPAFVIHAFINLSGDAVPLIEKSKEVQGNDTAWSIANMLLFVTIVIILSLAGMKHSK